jgi:ABC-type oligopeptide transport system substrate-binding subunit
MRAAGAGVALALAGLALTACGTGTGTGEYFGQVEPPEGQTLRYVSGGEPESLDPQIGTGQPESRIYAALFEGLTDYHPETGEVVPGLAERWDVSDGNTTFVFHLRPARWSDGTPITAHDFVYTIRRGLSPALAARNAYLAYDIVNAQAYNEGALFVRDPASGTLVTRPGTSAPLTVPADEEERTDAAGPELGALLRDKALIPVRAEDVAVEALDERTVRVRTRTSVPYLPALMAHQYFRLVPRQAIEVHGDAWTKPGNLVASSAFTLAAWRPYDRIVVVRNPQYWDAGRVALDRITFYALEEQTTMMNLYKAGELDATYNHTVPISWHESVRGFRDYMNAPEAANEYYQFNLTHPPMDDRRVRRAFNMAVDKEAFARFKRTARALTAFVPEGVFPGYPSPRGEGFDVEAARALLAEAGYRDGSGRYDPSRFPADRVELAYNTSENNRQSAEFMQAQWRQNLGITVPLRNMEFRTFLGVRNRREYRGIARAGWVGDYMDPYTFLDIFSTPDGNNGTGWFEPRYLEMLRNANREPEQARRYEMLARAEAYLLEAQPVLPLLTQETNWLKKPYVKGMYANPITIHPWKYVYIEHDRSRW